MATVEGDNSDNILRGTRAADRIRGQEGNDRLFGKAGPDFLAGGTGRDILFGHKGNDTLKDGFGLDQLWGGRGRDTFEFVRLEGTGRIERDIVRDYKDGVDKLDISAITTDFDDVIIRNTRSGDVRIRVDDRVIILRDDDDSLNARDITIDDFFGFT